MLAAATLLAAWHATPMRAQQARQDAPRPLAVRIRVNASTTLAGLRGVAFRGAVPATGEGGDEGVLVSLADLRRAVDGDTSARRSRLRRSGPVLFAIGQGACERCALRVIRPVQISRHVRDVAGDAYLPLADLVRALEGRVVAEDRHESYTVHVGTCHWCVLEPVGN